MTKKLPVPINPKTGQPMSGKDFLIPAFAGGTSAGFVGIASGKRYTHGCIVYLGKEVSATDVIARATSSGAVPAEFLAPDTIHSYLAQLDAFKVGNVVAVAVSADGVLGLSKQSSSPAPSSRPVLP